MNVATSRPVAGPRLAAVGGYTAEGGGRADGITVVAVDPDAITELGRYPMASPSWLAWHPALDVVYATSEVLEGRVETLGVRSDGRLEPLGGASSGGSSPCHLAVTDDARHLLVANYGGGVAAFALDAAGRIGERTELVEHDGRGPHAERQEASHPHSVVERTGVVTVVDLGTDELRSYRLSPAGRLEPLARAELPPGTGPRQLAFADGRSYVIGELSAQLLVLDEPEPGRFALRREVAGSTAGSTVLPAQLTIRGRFAYVSNRGPDTLAVLDLTTDPPGLVAEHRLEAPNPRHFAIDGGRVYVAAQDGDALVVFDLDSDGTGLTPGARHPMPSPTCIAFRPR
jgi:6-phosphogluconolactonase (cycloisomerase 2 family)